MTKNILHFQAKISAKLVKKKKKKYLCIILGKTMGLHMSYIGKKNQVTNNNIHLLYTHTVKQ